MSSTSCALRLSERQPDHRTYVPMNPLLNGKVLLLNHRSSWMGSHHHCNRFADLLRLSLGGYRMVSTSTSFGFSLHRSREDETTEGISFPATVDSRRVIIDPCFAGPMAYCIPYTSHKHTGMVRGAASFWRGAQLSTHLVGHYPTFIPLSAQTLIWRRPSRS